MPSPTGFSETTQKDFSYLGDNNIRALLSGSKWGSELGKAFTLTYSFPWTSSDGYATWDLSSIGGYTKNDTTNFNLSNEPYRSGSYNLNLSQQKYVKDALSKWANVANIKFNYIDESSTQVGDLRFTFTATDGNEGGHAYLTSTTAKAGDIWLPSEQINTTFQNPEIGTYGYLTFLHEIGHALGLKHTFEGYSLPVEQDWIDNSVMSYNDWKRSDDPNHLVTADFYPTTPMWYDIYALQFLYGANNSYHTGNDVYTYRENEHYWESIWDAGGDDTINYIGSVSAKIDLRDASLSDMGLDVQFSNNKSFRGTITILPGVVIENAYGGSGDDTLQGNGTNNYLDGRLGTDTAIFEGSKSDYKVQKVGDSYIVNSIAEGKDTLKNIEFVQFKDGTFAIDSLLEKTNHAPTGNSVALFAAINEDNGFYILKDVDYFQGFSDPDGDSLQTINIKATNGTLTKNVTGDWNLTPNANFNGIVELTYDVIDNKGGSIPAKMSFVINPVNDVPTGKAIGFDAGKEDTNYTLNATGLLNGFSDVDFDTLSVTNLTATNGKITANADGTWLLTPNVNFNGTVQLNYTVSDNKGGSTNAVINFVLNPVNDAPIGSVFVSGETQQGKILAASNTLSDADGIGVISYQWLSNGSVINGANQTTYTLTTSDVGKAISVKASYVDLQGTAESVSSSTTTLISALTNYPPTGNVKITGNAIVSGTLSIENTLADGNGVGSFMYQWLRNNDAITNATKSTYTLTPEDAGEEIAVVVGYIDGLGKQEGLASDAISILIPNHQPTGSLVIKGSPTVGNTLTLINTIQDADGLGEFSYSWETEDIVLTLSFDSETLKIASDAFGKEIWATVSYIDGAGNYEEIQSEPTLAVTVAKVSTVSSTGNDLITGTNKAEKLLGLAGDDTLIGGLGKDTLTGGKGADIFKYTSVKDSGIAATTRDTITDFKHSENDKIDLSALDANEKSAGEQTFAFIGNAAFSKTDATGQLRFDVKTGVLYASTDKDTAAEFSIKLNGVTSLVTDDFVL